MESLKKYMQALGVATTEVDELEAAIKQDGSSNKGKICGAKVSTWLGKMVSKAAAGTWDVATDVAASVLTKAIEKYYGLG
jgi:hypothetical protein